MPGRQRRVGGGLHAGGGPDMSVLHGVARRDVDRHGAAIALHDEKLVPVPLRREIGRELAQVAVDDRLHERIDRRRGPPLELAVLGQQLGAHRDIGIGPFGRGDLARPALVRIVQIGMDEVDHERLGALRPEPARRLAHLALGEGHDHLALGVHALVDLEAQIARDQRLEATLEPVRRGARAAPQLEHVAEAPRRDEPRPRALALEQRVGRGGRPVHDHLELGRPRRRARQRRLHTGGLVGDRRRHLRDAHLSGGFIHEHEIGERPAHIHPDQLRLRHRRASHDADWRGGGEEEGAPGRPAQTLRLLDRQVSRLGTAKQLVRIGREADMGLALICAIAHEPTHISVLAPAEHRRQPLGDGELGELGPRHHGGALREDHHSVGPGSPHR